MSEVEIPVEAKEYVEYYVDILVERGFDREAIMGEIYTIAEHPKIKESFSSSKGAWEYATRLVWNRNLRTCKECKFAVRNRELEKGGEIYCWVSQTQENYYTAPKCFYYFNKDNVDENTIKRALYELIKARRKR